MAADAPLSTLCGICYTGERKYRCPRCRTPTCSLPCYKRHQQRASCNGVRDPAAYKTRSQLVTPAAMDQDYNYLQSLEQGIDRAASLVRDVTRKGNTAAASSDTPMKPRPRTLHPESLLQKYLDANRITVDRAPIGMSRQRTNLTRTTKRSNVMWTLEWVEDNGIRQVQDNCLESSTLQEIFTSSQTQNGIVPAKRKVDPAEAVESCSLDTPVKRRRSSESEPSKTETFSVLHDQHTISESSTSEPTTAPAGQLRPSAEHHFYLLIPNTQTSRIILAPKEADVSLTRNLSGHTVLEYPTFYALPQDPASLPAKYQLHSDYISLIQDRHLQNAADTPKSLDRRAGYGHSGQYGRGRDTQKVDFADERASTTSRDVVPPSRTLSPSSPAPVARHAHQQDHHGKHYARPAASTNAAQPVDAKKILEMLRRDVSN